MPGAIFFLLVRIMHADKRSQERRGSRSRFGWRTRRRREKWFDTPTDSDVSAQAPFAPLLVLTQRAPSGLLSYLSPTTVRSTRRDIQVIAVPLENLLRHPLCPFNGGDYVSKRPRQLSRGRHSAFSASVVYAFLQMEEYLGVNVSPNGGLGHSARGKARPFSESVVTRPLV